MWVVTKKSRKFIFPFGFRTLLDFKANVNAVNKISKTPLIYAASENHLKCLEVLGKLLKKV